ncbi:NAD(P)-dependent oxidoreductase [Aestuariivirga litoralis]|uniref:NAD(P)-dependent oxidoreductase n=1 Tax=Aestuariivirga litoralis TaxID=2650924 RepID=UPI0018C84F01|nr:NAD(P)-dependent oxidoreductase [Aestuariivirga litoralis]MBG1233166.1 NAD(P)-dependent oxidoreductase [Aestuariivirga litoralis]
MSQAPDIQAKRLTESQLQANFADLHPPLDHHEALVESDRCYFCADAPCQQACPTSIDIPMFIREIQAGHPQSAAKTIFNQNILGGMCARVCPTETLCEEVCVREVAEGKPVKIGLLQRYATDSVMHEKHPFTRAESTGKKVAVVGAGPAGLACAHRAAMHGHDVTVFDAKNKAGGLNEFGIAAYKTVDDFAQKEVAFVLGIGGIKFEYGKALGSSLQLAQLEKDYDAVFLGLGYAGVNALGIADEDVDGVEDAVAYIAELRQAQDLSKLKVGRSVAVIGGGMTAVDIAVQSKLLGAEEVTILYRRGQDQMKASDFEQELAQTHGVMLRDWVMPKKLVTEAGKVVGLEVERTAISDGKLKGTGQTYQMAADVVFKAIGQTFVDVNGGAIALEGGRIKVDENKRTSRPKVWAGGDCVAGNQALTVAAVDDGRRAAESIHAVLTA